MVYIHQEKSLLLWTICYNEPHVGYIYIYIYREREREREIY